MDKKENIIKLLELYNTAIKNGKNGFETGVNYDFNHRVIYFEDEKEKICITITKNDLADKPDGVGDDMTLKIIQWAQQKY